MGVSANFIKPCLKVFGGRSPVDHHALNDLTALNGAGKLPASWPQYRQLLTKLEDKARFCAWRVWIV